MFPSSSVIKKNALSALKNNWGTAIAVSMIFFCFVFAIMLIGSFVGGLVSSQILNVVIYIMGAVIFVAVCVPLIFGIIRFFWHMADSGKTDVNDVFMYFSSSKMYFRAFHITLLLLAKILIIALLMYLPSIIVWLASTDAVKNVLKFTPLWMGNLWIIVAFLRVLGFVLTAIIALKYYLAPFVFVINDTIEPIEAIHLSSKAAALSVWNFVGLICTLIGWIILTMLAIPAFFTVPYFIMCYVVHSHFAVFNYNNWLKTKNT